MKVPNTRYANTVFARLMAMALFMAAAAACDSPPEPEPVLRPVRSIVPRSVGGELDSTFRGTIQPGDVAAIAFKVGGRVKTMNVEVGDLIKEGALLAELEDTELRLQLSQADAAVAQARAAAGVAKSTHTRLQSLYVGGNASTADLEGARANSDASAAQVVAAARQRDLANQQLKDTRLFSGRAGAVADVRASEGELVGAGSPVVVLTSGDRLQVVFGVPGQLIPRVERGMPVSITVRSDTPKTHKGAITEVGVTSTGSTFPVTAVFADDTPDLRAGLAVEVALRFPALDDRDRLVVPLSAVGEDENGPFVWTVTAAAPGQGTVERVAVTTGPWTADGIEITSGLDGDERVVTAGVSRISAGQVVRLDKGAGR